MFGTYAIHDLNSDLRSGSTKHLSDKMMVDIEWGNGGVCGWNEDYLGIAGGGEYV